MDLIQKLQRKSKGKSISELISGVGRVLLARWHLRNCNHVSRLVSVNGKPLIVNRGLMVIGDEVRIWSNIERAKLFTGSQGKLIIGRNSRINGAHISAHLEILIGENVRIAPYSIILDSDFHDVRDHFSDGRASRVVIENNVWLATRCTILKGVTIGEGSVVASGAVVTKNVPPRSVVAGVPARVIRTID